MTRSAMLLAAPLTTITVACAVNGEVVALVKQPSTTGATTMVSDAIPVNSTSFTVASTSSFATAGTFWVQATSDDGVTPVWVPIAYTSVSGGNTFMNCTTTYASNPSNTKVHFGQTIHGGRVIAWTGVDQWMNDPTQQYTPNHVDLYEFDNVSDVTYGTHLFGPAGPTGPTGPPGPVGTQAKGSYNPAIAYNPNDIVTYQPKTYICLQATAANDGNLPPASAVSTSFWDVIAGGGQAPVTTTPNAPTNVVATGGNAQATVTWATPTNNGGSAITGLTVTPYIAGVAQTTQASAAGTTSKVMTGLTNGTAYTFSVHASNVNGAGTESAQSNAVTPTAVANTVPGVPTNVSGVGSDSAVALSWTAPSNGGATITSYTVQQFVGATAGATTTVSGNPAAPNATIINLVNGTAYTFKVLATNSVGSSAYSTASAAITPTAAPVGQAGALDVPGQGCTLTTWDNFSFGDNTIWNQTNMNLLGTYVKGVMHAAGFGAFGTNNAWIWFSNSGIANRVRAAGMNNYMMGWGFSSQSASYARTMVGDWASDTTWGAASTVLTGFGTMAHSSLLRQMYDLGASTFQVGAQGIQTDSEPYGSSAPWGGVTVPTWDWNYPTGPYSGTAYTTRIGNVVNPATGVNYTEADIKVLARRRGAQFTAAFLAGWQSAGGGTGEAGPEFWHYQARPPGCCYNFVSFGVYGDDYPRKYSEIVSGTSTVQRDVQYLFHIGLLDTVGLKRVRYTDEAFYYGTQGAWYSNQGQSSDDGPIVIGAMECCSWFSQFGPNWNYWNNRLSVTPMTWLGPDCGDQSTFAVDNAVTPARGPTWLAAWSKYGMSGVITSFQLSPWLSNGSPAVTVPYPVLTHIANWVSGAGGANCNPDANGHLRPSGDWRPSYAAPTSQIWTAAPPVIDVTGTRGPALTWPVTTNGAKVCVGRAYPPVGDTQWGIRCIRWIVNPTAPTSNGAASHVITWLTSRTYTTAVAAPDPDVGKQVTTGDGFLHPNQLNYYVTFTTPAMNVNSGQTVRFQVEDLKGRAAQFDVVAP